MPNFSLLVADLSTNSVIRTVPLANALRRLGPVLVHGFLIGDAEVFHALRDAVEYRPIRVPSRAHIWSAIPTLTRQATGDVLVAFKPLLPSLLPAMAAGRLRRVPVLLDIEDWEVGAYLDHNPLRGRIDTLWRHLVHRWRDPFTLKWLIVAEWLARFATARTVVSSFLADRFGGSIVYHGPDTSVVAPDPTRREAVRRDLGLGPTDLVILFAGVARPHKGLHLLAEALPQLGPGHDFRLLVVGPRADPETERALDSLPAHQVLRHQSVPNSEMPGLVDASDLVVLPSLATRTAQAQVPAKLFEAMAMAKPVFASRLSDIPTILDDPELVFEPGSVDAIAERLTWFSQHPAPQEIGSRLRQRCIDMCSIDAIERAYRRILEPLVSLDR